jgi:hypothetical protein
MFFGGHPRKSTAINPARGRYAMFIVTLRRRSYPTVQMRGAADNVVIWSEYVDACLALESVLYVLIEESDEARASYSFLILSEAQPPFRDVAQRPADGSIGSTTLDGLRGRDGRFPELTVQTERADRRQ